MPRTKAMSWSWRQISMCSCSPGSTEKGFPHTACGSGNWYSSARSRKAGTSMNSTVPSSVKPKTPMPNAADASRRASSSNFSFW